jgi:virulence factor Mce-like protein
MRQSRAANIAGSPTMVGAITVLIIILAVFLAYNANNGLPFVPTYRLSAQVPNAETLVPGNDIQVGGVRVGAVEAVQPEQHADGSTSATIHMKLNKQLQPLPVDSTVIVRSRSALGLKYLQIVKGQSTKGFPEGDTMPLSAAKPEPVEIDQVLNTFDAPTRAAIKLNIREFGTAVAGRGAAINAAIGELRPLIDRLEPVMRNIGAPGTHLARFIQTLSATAAEVAPVAEVQAELFVNLDTTFGALAQVARPFIQETISKSPPTEETGIQTLPRIRPFLRDSTALFTDLQPAARTLRATSPEIAAALVAGVPALLESPALNRRLEPTFTSLLNFAQDPTVTTGIKKLTQAFTALNPTLSFITPAQSVCNYATLLLRNAASLISLGSGLGNWQRFIVLNPPSGPNNEGSPSSAPANGPSTVNHLHVNPYPNTAAPGQTHECEAGNEVYKAGQTVIGNVPGNQGTKTAGQG